MIIGREKELNILREATKSEYSTFIAVYGRRRIGKTFLVREAFNYDFVFQHSGLFGGKRQQQLNGFVASLVDAGLKPERKPKCWIEAFELLKTLIRTSRKRKKVIFIDELSWMDTPKSDLMMALEFFWNSWASARKDIILIVCASATSWMLKKVIHNKGGLYNRLNHRLHIKSFTLSECEKIVKARNISFSRNQIAEFYMVVGGVPYYWTLLDKSLSMPQNIDAIIFDDDAPLKDEYRYLFSSIFNSPEPYLKIIEKLSEKKFGLTRAEIINAMGTSSNGKLSTILDDLESCGFIRRYQTFGKSTKDSVYQLVDNFIIFYHHFIKDNNHSTNLWSRTYNTPKLNTWRGIAFERLCLEHVSQIKDAIGISGIESSDFSWSCSEDRNTGRSGAQIDLVINRNDATITVCEMKYYNDVYSIDKETEQSLRVKINDFIEVTHTQKSIMLTLVTTYGLKDNAHSAIINSVVTLQDLFIN